LSYYGFINVFPDSDVYGRIYEELEKFAMSEGRGGGDFFTRTFVVCLLVNIIEPFIRHQDIMIDGTLEFDMNPVPGDAFMKKETQ
jgi:type I restriction-modification system DNA methylase subunit